MSELALAVLLTLLAASESGPHATVRAARHAHELIATLPDTQLECRLDVSRVVDRTWATAALDLGRLDEATAAYDSVTRAGLGTGNAEAERGYIDALGHLALLASWRGKMRRAVRLAHQALAVRGEARQESDDAVVPAEVALGFLYAETQDLTRARRHVAAALERNAAGGDAFVRAALALVQARLQRAAGDLTAARAALAALGSSLPRWLLDPVRAELARIDVVEGRAAPADEVLTEDPPTALTRQAVPDLSERIDKRLAESQRRLRRGDRSGAIEALDRALRLAAPEHIRRPFLDAPVEVRRLLRSGDTRLIARHAWLISDRATSHGSDGEANSSRAETTMATVSSVVIEPLTAKETEVLSHLAQLLTTEEIASAMYVSVNTIRTHVRNILRKLSASRRNEAIRRAREFGILSS